MQAFDIAHLADHPFGTVSVGEQRRVLLARALVKSPILLVLDEPCQGLDGQNRIRILQMLDQLCKHTLVNLIYVTHHWNEMPDAITHVLRLENGQIQDTGTRNSVFCETKN
jgi:molybdate transport system ATP-binding protein